MVSATAGTSARRTMFSRPRYLMLGSRTLMNLPSIATPAPSQHSRASVYEGCPFFKKINNEDLLHAFTQRADAIPQSRQAQRELGKRMYL